MTARRRRVRHRSRFNPLRFVPPETWPILWRGLIGTGVAGAAAAPALVVRQEAGTKAQATSEALNVALGAAAALQDSLSVFREQFSEFEREMRETRRRERDVRARLPENVVGPPVVYDVGKRRWQVRGG